MIHHDLLDALGRYMVARYGDHERRTDSAAEDRSRLVIIQILSGLPPLHAAAAALRVERNLIGLKRAQFRQIVEDATEVY